MGASQPLECAFAHRPPAAYFVVCGLDLLDALTVDRQGVVEFVYANHVPAVPANKRTSENEKKKKNRRFVDGGLSTNQCGAGFAASTLVRRLATRGRRRRRTHTTTRT